jgi:tetratricopeptide (TPR) repeat protein
MYRIYSRIPSLLEQAEQAAERVRELEGETAQYAWVKSTISHTRGDLESALSYAKHSVQIDPNYAGGYEALYFAYKALGHLEAAANAGKETLRLLENDKTVHFNLLVAMGELPASPENREELRRVAERATQVYKRYMRQNPNDYNARVQFANILQWANRTEESLYEADRLSLVESLDGVACYNLACLYLHASDKEKGIAMLRRSIGKGYQNIELFRRDPDLDPLRGTPEFEALMKELEEKIKSES